MSSNPPTKVVEVPGMHTFSLTLSFVLLCLYLSNLDISLNLDNILSLDISFNLDVSLNLDISCL